MKTLCSLTDGNLSRQIQFLQENGLLEVWKGFAHNRPRTVCRLTGQGRQRFLEYVAVLENIVRDAHQETAERKAKSPQPCNRPPFPRSDFAQQICNFRQVRPITLPCKVVFSSIITPVMGITVLEASIGPIVCFFSFTTTSYPFMILLNVFVFTIAGLLGSAFLLQTLHRLTSAFEATPPPLPDASTEPAGPIAPITAQIFGTRARTIFQSWVIVFGLVGAQMAWVLRPFIGHPGQPFSWFRPQSSNFFQAVLGTIQSLMH